MKQRPIDLLPQEIRARTQAGVVTGWYVAALLIGVVLTGLLATHANLVRERARARLKAENKQADLAMQVEEKADAFRAGLQKTRQDIDRYDLVALPLDLSRVMATVVNALPRSATLEHITFDAARRGMPPPRTKPGAEGAPPPGRLLVGELSGFAMNDVNVVRIVTTLHDIGLFEQVGLDYSKSTKVRNYPARHFRISLRANLDLRYEVSEQEQAPVGAREVSGVQ